jgi:RNA-directed DNA polymerase
MKNAKEIESEHNEIGTPQGGVISPLLCNIALHGMETELMKAFSRYGVKVIRYADDFIVTGRKLEDIHKSKEIINDFLKAVGLELSEEKTRIGHTMFPIEQGRAKPGLEFLGFHFRNIRTSIHRGVKTTRGVKQNFRQISSPSLDSVKNHKIEVRDILKKYKNAPRTAVISALSLKIQGWTRYYSITKCSIYFSSMDKWLF